MEATLYHYEVVSERVGMFTFRVRRIAAKAAVVAGFIYGTLRPEQESLA